jgi:diketogulonate reductase-like aldo/keto reductase/HEAT repeat protein
MRASADTRRARHARVARLDPGDPHDLYTLRDAFVTGDDAEVAAAALLRLDASGARRLLPYVRDAASDASMRVREAAFVALARARDAASLSRAAYACRYDGGFRVRRMAVLFAVRTCGAESLPVLAIASRDPFWRVRVTARRAAAALDATVDTRPVGAETQTGTSVPGFDDPDPAVVTARIARAASGIDPRALVGALGHSHQALRRIAVNEIAARGDVAVLRGVTRWLVDERVPYGPSAARATLARSGARAAALAAEILAAMNDEPAGPLAWAITATAEAPEWARTPYLLRHADARVRRAACVRVPEAAPDRGTLLQAMAALLRDEDEETRNRAAAWLAQTGSREARGLLLGLEPAAQSAPVRALLVDLHSSARDTDALRELARDPHGRVRAAALAALSALGALTASERSELATDPDPWIRGAVLDSMEGDAQRAWAASAFDEPDAPLRACAVSVLAATGTDESTRTLLRLARDTDFGVRSAAVEALASRHEPARHLLEAGALGLDERIAAYTLLRLAGDARAAPAETEPEALAHLALLDDALTGRSPQRAQRARARAAQPAVAHRRALGRSDIAVHPFGLSGAHGLSFDDFARAHERGVNLFFWEPGHRELGRFLRARSAPGAVVVAGTYHADAASVERDVLRTLRALRRETVDVFLAFWTRSRARIDEVADTLTRLAERGWIRARGLSTHDRTLACDAADRGLDVVMVRHSAAHRGAEVTVFPRCAAHGTGVLTFSNLCYGRMLHRTPAKLSAKVTAPDCYRYSLAQPGVHACIAAPRRYSELIEDLAVVDDPAMGQERQRELRTHGDHVYERSKAWSAETWSVAEHPRPHGNDSAESLSDWIDAPESISRDMW